MSHDISHPFQVVSDYEPAGDQPTAIEMLVQGVAAGLAHQTLLGVTGSGKTFTIAKVVERIKRPTIVMAHNKTLAAQLYGEFKEFFPHNAVEYFVSYYDYYQPEAYVPASDTFIEKDASINDHIEQMRLSATKALLEREDVIIVATVSSIYGLGDPEAYHEMVLHLTRGLTIDQRQILRRWRNYNTSAMTWTSDVGLIEYVAMSLISFRPNQIVRVSESNYLMMRSKSSHISILLLERYSERFLV